MRQRPTETVAVLVIIVATSRFAEDHNRPFRGPPTWMHLRVNDALMAAYFFFVVVGPPVKREMIARKSVALTLG